MFLKVLASAAVLFGGAVLLLKAASVTESYPLLGGGLLLAIAGLAISLRDGGAAAA